MSSNKSYDHHEKAGNEGDICKHPALIAALDETIVRTPTTPFRYADIFAGYARSPLLEGNEWSNGIRAIAGDHLLKGNRHVAFWARCSGLEHAPPLDKDYPGSAWFAREVCRSRDRTVELSLWDTSAEPFADLKATFSKPHDIFNRAAKSNELRNADFVFIDPPDKCHWASILKLLHQLEPKQSILIWLPMGPNTKQKPPAEDGTSIGCREDALQLGMGVSAIRWAKGGHTIGCQFLYRVNPKAQRSLRAAVKSVVEVARLRRGKSRKWAFPPVHYDPQRRA